MNDKKKFLEKVSALFLENGAKTLTMDDIAKEFSMSKKTLYQQYKNKEELLDAVMDFQIDETIAKIKAITEKTELNSIEKMIIRDEHLRELSDKQKSFFIRQVKKYYPTLKKNHSIKAYEKLKVIFLNNIEQGRKEGLYRQDFNAEEYVRLFILLAFSYEESPIMEDAENKGLNRCEFSKQVITFYLNAIVTEEGRKFL